MKHEELVIRIIEMSGDETINWRLYPALRKVVELHKPVEGHEHLCSACCFGDGLQAYPCQTIVAIEKELG